MAYKLKDLKKLVESLSSAEKRHFSLLSSAFSESEVGSLYLQLFHALSRPKTDLSEPGLKDITFSVTPVKNRLFKNIRKSLRLFHQDQSIEIRIQNYLSDIEILYGLSLPEQSLYLLRKAYKDAVAYEKFRLLLQVLEWERKLNIVLDQPTRSIKAIAEEEQEVLRKLLQIVQLENIYGKAKDMKRQHGSVKGKLRKNLEEETIKAPGMIPFAACASQKAKFFYNFTFTLYYWMIYNHIMAYQHSKALLNLRIKTILPNDYVDGVLEHVTSCIQIGKFKEALNGLELASDYIKEQKLNLIPSFNTKIFFYKTGYHLVIYNYTGQKKRLADTITLVERELRLYEDKMPMEARQVIHANLMNAYIGTGNIKAADTIWEQLFHKTSKSVRREIYDDLHLFRLFNLLQNKIYDVLPYTALAAHRYYKQFQNEATDFKLELQLTALLLKEYNLENVKVRRTLLAEIKQILLQYIAALKGTNNFQEHYSFYVIWAQSILEEEPYHVSAAAWYEQFKKDNPS
jgi:hypothetical protein